MLLLLPPIFLSDTRPSHRFQGTWTLYLSLFLAPSHDQCGSRHTPRTAPDNVNQVTRLGNALYILYMYQVYITFICNKFVRNATWKDWREQVITTID